VVKLFRQNSPTGVLPREADVLGIIPLLIVLYTLLSTKKRLLSTCYSERSSIFAIQKKNLINL
ncbi:MAG: hypothetical protein KA402_01635, partial [Bacteroides sp.]|nr:hypothetical protein [Bacteroides sp.]